MENISLNYLASDFVQLAFWRCIREWKFHERKYGRNTEFSLLKFLKRERSLSSYAFLALMHSDTSINTRDTTVLGPFFTAYLLLIADSNLQSYSDHLMELFWRQNDSLLTCSWLLILIYRVTLTTWWSCFDGKMTPYERAQPECCLIRIPFIGLIAIHFVILQGAN